MTVHVEGFSEVECKCGCGNLLPLTVYDRGWRYLRGHKGYVAGESPAHKAERFAAKMEHLRAEARAELVDEMARERKEVGRE